MAEVEIENADQVHAGAVKASESSDQLSRECVPPEPYWGDDEFGATMAAKYPHEWVGEINRARGELGTAIASAGDGISEAASSIAEEDAENAQEFSGLDATGAEKPRTVRVSASPSVASAGGSTAPVFRPAPSAPPPADQPIVREASLHGRLVGDVADLYPADESRVSATAYLRGWARPASEIGDQQPEGESGNVQYGYAIGRVTGIDGEPIEQAQPDRLVGFARAAVPPFDAPDADPPEVVEMSNYGRVVGEVGDGHLGSEPGPVRQSGELWGYASQTADQQPERDDGEHEVALAPRYRSL